MKRLKTINVVWLVVALCLAGGCASKPPASREESLLIGGQTINQLIPAADRKRIDNSFQPGYRGNLLIAQAMGAEIAHRQRLAVSASDVYIAQPQARRAHLAGWLVTRKNGKLEVLFIAKGTKKTPRVVATAQATTDQAKPRLDTLQSPRALTDAETALWQARALAFTARITPCTKNYQPVIIPVEAGGKKQIFVYLLPLAPAGTMMLGGYYRIRINADGSQILDTHGYTRSCLKMQRNPKAVGIAVTENESPTPTAPQVYANLRYGLPVYVTTSKNNMQWEIKQGHITALKKPVGQ